MTEWTNERRQAALGEGWDVFEAHGDHGPEMQLKRVDYLIVFKDDADVWAHVWSKAKAGSQLHTDALDFLRQANPAEYKDINDWNEQRSQA